MPFPLLSLPVELRLRVYDYMLNPAYASSGNSEHTRINWIYSSNDQGNNSGNGCINCSRNQGHSVSGSTSDWCACRRSGAAWIPGPPLHLSPAILATSRSVYTEALPRLYERRSWEAVNFRTFGTQHDSLLERWWILDTFLASLNPDARRRVVTIRVPVLLSFFETYGCKDAFRSIQARLPRLRLVEIEPVLLNSSGWLQTPCVGVKQSPGEQLVWPVMMFDADVKLLYSPSVSFSSADTERGLEPSMVHVQQSHVDMMIERRRKRRHAAPNDHDIDEDDETSNDQDDSIVGISSLWDSSE